MAGDELLAWLQAYAAAGGHLVIGRGPRTGTTRVGRGPRSSPLTWPTPRASATEFSNLLQPVPVTLESDGFSLSDGAAAVDWSDGLVSDGSKIVLGYDHPHFRQFPAVVSTEHGNGRITTVGTVPNASWLPTLLRWLAPGSASAGMRSRRQSPSATNRRGERIRVLHNWGWQPVSVSLPQPMCDVVDAEGDICSRGPSQRLGCPGVCGEHFGDRELSDG